MDGSQDTIHHAGGKGECWGHLKCNTGNHDMGPIAHITVSTECSGSKSPPNRLDYEGNEIADGEEPEVAIWPEVGRFPSEDSDDIPQE